MCSVFLAICISLRVHTKETAPRSSRHDIEPLQETSGEFLKEATDLCVIDRINANEFTHNNKFIKMIQAKRYADEAQKDFLSQHDMYREVILRFGNTVPTHEQLERFFKSYGHEPKTDSTTRKIISSISKSLRELEAINMLNFDLDLLRGAEKPKDVDRNGGQRGKNRGKNRIKTKTPIITTITTVSLRIGLTAIQIIHQHPITR